MHHRLYTTALLLCFALVAGCSSMTKVYDDVVGDLLSPDEAPTTKGRFYVAVESLSLYAEPSFSSEELAELSRNEAVDRDDLSQGFAHVRVVRTGETGWLDNAKLGWRPPRSETPEPETEPKEEPEAEAPEPEPETARVEPDPPEPAPAPAKQTDASPTNAPGDASGTRSEDGKNVDPALFDAF